MTNAVVLNFLIALTTIVGMIVLALANKIDGATAVGVVTAIGATSGAAGARVYGATKAQNGAG